ncbi:helix-turn-helix domain-containing protein [Roseospira goensis]|uniref:helix-turn-helix domain-containing protein n=1 Tax=Roseospira goensis TaxID=391922 RepID=UPI001FE7BE79|nr:helix-turn-helix domain-containing protein [Roseospira goensis]
MTEVARLPELMSEKRAASILDVSLSTIQRMRKAGKIKAKLIGGRWKYRLDWIKEYLDEADNICESASASVKSANTISRNGQTQTVGAPHGSTLPLDRQSANRLAQATFGTRN